MKFPFSTSQRRGTWIGGLSCLMTLSTLAFPPAPDHVFYGLVRDELGNPLTAAADIILETSAGTQVKGQIIPGFEPGVNYELTVPMDSGISDDLYKPTALRPTVPFRMKVRIGTTVYLPIEMRGDYTRVGQPGQRTHLDLTLGEDANGNGLPDAWEKAFLQAAGGKGPVRPEDDSDGDGLSNLQEYIAGTYAFDSKDGFELKILATQNQTAQLSFTAIRGRTYSIFGSTDFQTWVPVQFRVLGNDSDNPVLSSYYASDVRLLQVEAPPVPDQPPMRFFKLMVQ